jgi:cob(I)alamin adenosyltransferase
MNTGFTWDTQDREGDIAAAEKTWAHAEQLLRNPEVKVVVLDELTYMLTYGYLDHTKVLDALKQRPTDQHVIVTGRNANDQLIAMADTVSEINDVKHAFNAGVRVQSGIDY